jgi:hypothetical protein
MIRSLAQGTAYLATLVLGWAFVVVGLVMLVTPGPGLLALAAGTALLSRHHHWVARLRSRTLERLRPGTMPATRPDRSTAAGPAVLDSDAA